jgi:hypothetical protein
MNKLFSGILACMLMLTPLTAQDNPAAPYIPDKMVVTGAVVVKTPRIDPRDPKGPKLGNSAIVNGMIWWEGRTAKVRKDDNSWVTLTLTKVEMVKGKGGVLTFTVELTRHAEKPTFQVAMKKGTGWGLQKAKK